MQAVQEYRKRKLEFPAIRSPRPVCLLAGDEVLITAADLEGYGMSEDDSNDISLSLCRIIRTRSMTTGPLKEDEVLVTEADLEGYETYADAYKDASVSSNGIVKMRPMIKRLSCLFASKFSGSCQPAASRLAEVRAC